MAVQTGSINVQTENIFPIIKKFLYSDHDIFLRELVSNSVDATQKINKLATLGKYNGELGNTQIDVEVDEKKKIITIRDRGIGMTKTEVEKYINEIALSSAEDFVKKYKIKGDSGIIGHFGLGFYSAFMVADKVELITKSYKKGKAVRWSCEGKPEYHLEESDKKERGTEVILHLNEESKEFANKARIQELLDKYCKFLPVEIKFNEQVINNTDPIWTKQPTDLKDEDYKNFYKELYPLADDPLFWVHLNIDYPFNLTGILYFPPVRQNMQIDTHKIQLYSNQVFVTNSVEGIVPEFLLLLHGVIDSPDIPLNISRSYLQSDSNVKKISSYITRKVADKLNELFTKERKLFEEKWPHINIFIKHGMITNEKFYEKAQNFALVKNIKDKFFTLDEFKNKISDKQKDKDDKVIFLYATDINSQHNYIETAENRGYEVLVLDSPVDQHFISTMESKMENVVFKRVDSDSIDKLVDKGEEKKSRLDDKQKEQLEKLIRNQVEKEKFEIKFENLNEKDQPVMITQSEYSRRMKEMSEMSGMPMGQLPDQFQLIVNTNHPLMSTILVQPEENRSGQLIRQAIDVALLSKGLLKGEELSSFVNKSFDLIKESAGKN